MEKSNPLKEYRDFLVKADHQASLNFDQAVMTLSGGALGISITFLKEIVPSPQPETRWLLLVGWTAFAISLASILMSYPFSMKSLRTAIKQVDDDTIHSDKQVGGWATAMTKLLRYLAAICFLIGMIFFLLFIFSNY